MSSMEGVMGWISGHSILTHRVKCCHSLKPAVYSLIQERNWTRQSLSKHAYGSKLCNQNRFTLIVPSIYKHFQNECYFQPKILLEKLHIIYLT